MQTYSTSEAAQMIGIHRVNLQKAIQQGRVKAPQVTSVGGVRVRLWTREDVERARKALKGSKQ